MVHDNFPAGVIVTNGLGGNYQSWILAQFHLFLGVGSPPTVEVEVAIRSPGGTGFRPDIYYPPRPRDDDEDEVIWKPRDEEEHEVIINIRLGSRKMERHYFVKKRTSVVVTQVIKFMNTTRSRINVTIGAFTKTAKDVAVALRNLGRKS